MNNRLFLGSTKLQTRIVFNFLFLTLLLTHALFGQGPRKGYAVVNGLKMYYEIYGTGKPLVLIHGSFMSLGLAYGALIPEFAKSRQVIAVEMQGHGRTADIDRPFSFEAMADDVAGLLKELKIDSADICGYSMGGGVALQLAINNPHLVRKLVVISAVYKSQGWYPETLAVFPMLTPQMFEGTPIKKDYDSLAPDPKHWTAFVNKMKTFVTTQYEWPASSIKAIQAPTLIIAGDSDGVTPEHAVDMFRLRGGGRMGDLAGLPNSQLAILPASSHVGVMMRTEWLASMIPAFLDVPVTKGQ